MKFNRKELLAATARAIKAVGEADEAAYVKALAEYEDNKKAWTDEHAELWRVALPKLMDRLRKGEPIYRNDLPRRNRYDQLAVFDERKPAKRESTVPRELRTLAAILPTITDDEVTPGGLRDVGVPPSGLREALRHMSTSEGTP